MLDVRICDLLLGPPLGWPRLVDRLDKAAEQLRAELAAQREADAELEALRTSAARIHFQALIKIDPIC
jgi:hypothetical protein